MNTIKAARRSTIEATFRVRIQRQRERVQSLMERADRDDGARRIPNGPNLSNGRPTANLHWIVSTAFRLVRSPMCDWGQDLCMW